MEAGPERLFSFDSLCEYCVTLWYEMIILYIVILIGGYWLNISQYLLEVALLDPTPPVLSQKV